MLQKYRLHFLIGCLLMGGSVQATSWAATAAVFARTLPAKVGSSLKNVSFKGMGKSIGLSIGNFMIASKTAVLQNKKMSAGALALGVFACYDLLKTKIWSGTLEELDKRQKFIIRPRVNRLTRAIAAATNSVAICRALEHDLTLKYPHTREKSSQQLKDEISGLARKVDETLFAINARKTEQMSKNLKKEHDAQEINQDCAYMEACQNFTKAFLPILEQHKHDLKISGAGRPGSRLPYWRNIEVAITFHEFAHKCYAKADVSDQFRRDLAALEAQKPWSWLKHGWQIFKKEVREFFS